jgi:hypothetical protein
MQQAAIMQEVVICMWGLPAVAALEYSTTVLQMQHMYTSRHRQQQVLADYKCYSIIVLMLESLLQASTSAANQSVEMRAHTRQQTHMHDSWASTHHNATLT